MIRAMIGATYQYLKRVLTSLSVLLNVLAGGYNNQTFSARNYDWMKQGKPNMVKLIDFVLGKDHCMCSWVYWKVRREW
jgi:hypothetical protein